MAEPGLELDIDTSEINELIKQFPEYTDVIIDEIRIAMISSLFMFHELVVGGTPKNTGALQQSFVSRRRVRRGEKVFTGSVSTPLAYGLPIERGRTPGKQMPPPAAIELWIRRTWKEVPSDKEIKGVAYVVARAIGKKGFKKVDGYRMVENAFDDGEPKANKLFDLATQKAVNKIEKKIEAID
jgi:hypothetical protein